MNQSAALYGLKYQHWSKMPPEDTAKPLWCGQALGRCLLVQKMTGSSCLDSHSPVKLSEKYGLRPRYHRLLICLSCWFWFLVLEAS